MASPIRLSSLRLLAFQRHGAGTQYVELPGMATQFGDGLRRPSPPVLRRDGDYLSKSGSSTSTNRFGPLSHAITRCPAPVNARSTGRKSVPPSSAWVAHNQLKPFLDAHRQQKT